MCPSELLIALRNNKVLYIDPDIPLTIRVDDNDDGRFFHEPDADFPDFSIIPPAILTLQP